MSFREHYEKKINTLPPTFIDSNILESKPGVYSGLFGVGTKAELSIMGHTFEIDEAGMLNILDMVDTWWNTCEPLQKSNTMSIIVNVSNIVSDYLGGRGDPKLRKDEYFSAPDHTLTMSEIKDKGIAQCSERSIITNQVLNVLNETGEIPYKSSVVNTRMHSNGSEAHTMLLLEHQDIPGKRILFDVENPLSVNVNGNTYIYPALYPLSEEEYEAFMSGQTITPTSFWESKGLEVLDDTRSYGQEDPPTM